MRPSSWLKAVPRQTEQRLAMRGSSFSSNNELLAACRRRPTTTALVVKAENKNGSDFKKSKKIEIVRQLEKNKIRLLAMPLARAIAPLFTLALALCGLVSKSFALESECSACEVVAVRAGRTREGRIESFCFLFSLLLDLLSPLLTLHSAHTLTQAALASRIASEGAQTVLDLRGRLGPQAGQRKGKRLDWKSSETRLAGLLEGLCDSSSLDADFAVKKKEKDKKEETTVGLSVVPKEDDDDDEDEDEEEDEESGREVLWLRRGEEGETEASKGFSRVTEAREKDYRTKQLEGWCGRLVSEVEEGLAREFARSGGSEGGGGASEEEEKESAAPAFDAKKVLCERLSRSCVYSKKAGAAAEKAAAAPASKQGRSWRGKAKQKQKGREEL